MRIITLILYTMAYENRAAPAAAEVGKQTERKEKNPMKRILILGGGTGGTILANILTRRLRPSEAEITLISASDRHFYQPAWLYIPFEKQSAKAVSRPLRNLLHRRVNLLISNIVELDTHRNWVRLSDGAVIHYDYLVIATGSEPVAEAVPGLRQHSTHFYTNESAQALFAALRKFNGGRIVVGVASLPYKCPPAPLEFAFLLEDFLVRTGRRERTQLTYTYPLDRVFPVESVAEFVQPLLNERGLTTEVPFVAKEVRPGIVVGTDGKEIDFDLLVMTPPHGTAKFLQGHAIADEGGWIKTDPATLEVKGYPNLWALGDTTNLPVPKAGTAAHFEAIVVAERIVAELRGAPPDPHRARYDGHVICFMETGHRKAARLDFDYKRPLEPGGPNLMNHYLKLVSRQAYWSHLASGMF